MKYLLLLLAMVSVVFINACSSTTDSGGGGGSETSADALVYATFGETVNNAVPDGLKTGGVSANLSAKSLLKDLLAGTCHDSYEGCPYITEAGGADSSTAGEILSRLWGIDYDSECTDELLADGTCFTCTDCNTGGYGNNYIKPLLLEAPENCASTSTTTARYVNFGMDPCFFDNTIGQISNITECETVAGGDVDISSAVPWYASWGIPQIVNFSSYNSRDSGGGIWWTVNEGDVGTDQYFLSLDSNWLYAGVKNTTTDEFLFFGTGSPAYYTAEAEDGGYETGINMAGYAGTISTIPASFETIQIRDQDPNEYIKRMKSNGEYLWYQGWDSNDFPQTPDDVAGVRDDPSENVCLEIGESIATSMYVPLQECVDDFLGEGHTVADLNVEEGNYIMKVVDAQTVGSIDFSISLTPTVTSDSCLEEEIPETPPETPPEEGPQEQPEGPAQ